MQKLNLEIIKKKIKKQNKKKPMVLLFLSPPHITHGYL